tara:strand:+ start:5994 stop:6125 length:132 start_codon:yes stop_codon:yes gene_type:complete
MIKENNNKNNLKRLLKLNKIKFQNYLFRLKANQLNINTYKLNK